jgi:hypothetical protein
MHDLLILGPDNWRDALERFRDYKQDTGISSRVVTLQETSAGPGADAPERIKRLIEHARRTDGTTHVLLVGDCDQFPVRYIRAVNSEWGTTWYASDLYYADLYDKDGAFDDWDADGDGIYAEMDFTQTGDGAKFNIDKINLRPDVVVGRVPASTLAEAEQYFAKVRSYEFAARESQAYGYPTDWFRDAVVVSGQGFSTESNAQAVPLAVAGFRLTKLSEDDPAWSGAALSAARHAQLRARLDQGAGFLHVNGHGNVSGFSDWCSTADVAALTNEGRLPVVVVMNCFSAMFHFSQESYTTAMGSEWTGPGDYSADRPVPAPVQTKHDRDAMAEEFLVRRPTGGVAFIGATSKFEFGGDSLVRYFLEAYRDAPKPPTIGSLWQKALTRFVETDLGGGTLGMGPYYAFIHAHKVMLFGDPSLRVGGLAHYTWPLGSSTLDAELADAAVG